MSLILIWILDASFHIKKLDDELSSQIKKALKIRYDLYKNKGWI